MQEKELEQKLVIAVKRLGGLALKLTSFGYVGMPDRLALLPDGIAVFIEVKAPHKTPSPLQLKRHRMLRRLGFKVYVLNSEKGIEAILEDYANETT